QLSLDGTEQVIEESMYWFKVGNILKWNEDPEIDLIIDGLVTKCRTDEQKESIQAKRRFIRKALETLVKRISGEKLINYFEVNKSDLEDILKIFIRVNSGGKQLSKTDLLFSTIVATWDDGREKIEELLRNINNKGDRFGFSNEYLMRCCLVLTDAPVLFKVNSFKSENVQKIQNNWGQIANSIEKTVELLVEYGFSQSLLTSQNSTIIIAYYIYKGGVLDSTTKLEIKRYLIHSLLVGIYGNSQDQLISTLRNAFRNQEKSPNGAYELRSNRFSFDELLKVELPSRKSLYISDLELDTFLAFRKGASSFLVLSLLYPHLKYKEVQFHQDHIHPAAGFSQDAFNKLVLSKEEAEEWLQLRDMIPNLQLMEGRQNESKNATAFIEWFATKNDAEREHFQLSNYIPVDSELNFKDFKSFFEKRRVKLKEELKKVLSINKKIDVESEVISEGVLSDDIDVSNLLDNINMQ
ncbi:MAG: hypothetical protein JWQ09_3176, partial [Segetibacter sp.]|nr:hypothetical protein [Segetibacter sp.]